MVQREWTDYDAVKDNETSIPAIKETGSSCSQAIDE
jgi:hypothetical protein